MFQNLSDKLGEWIKIKLELSDRKDIPSHYHLDFNQRQGSVLFDQARVFDVRRLKEQIGRLGSVEAKKISSAFIEFNFGKLSPPR